MKRLSIPKGEFKFKIEMQIAEGWAILQTFHEFDMKHQFSKIERAYERWNLYNYNFLEESFNDFLPDSYAAKYKESGTAELQQIASELFKKTDSLAFRHDFFADFITPKIEYLGDILAQLDFMYHVVAGPPPPLADNRPSLAHLHPTIQQVIGSLFASNHYPQAILAACTALDKAVQAKAQLPPTTVGTALMTTAFSAKSPLIQLSQDANEQMGFMNLYQGSVQAIRNHYAHNLTEIPAARALEWLSFISALFYKLDEAQSLTNNN
jgi:uncharacterized protein (TIGR02391 family)